MPAVVIHNIFLRIVMYDNCSLICQILKIQGLREFYAGFRSKDGTYAIEWKNNSV